MNKFKQLIEKRNTLVKALSDMLDKADEEKRALTAEEVLAFEAKQKEIKEIDKTLQLAEEVRAEGMTAGKTKQDKKGEEEEIRAFTDYLRHSAIGEVRAEDANFTRGDNGVIVPKTIASKIIETVKNIAPVYALSSIYNVKGELVFPVYNETEGKVTCNYAEEFQKLSATSGKFTSVNLKGYLAGALAKISLSLVNNTEFDLANYVITKVAESVAEFMEKELLLGTENKMTGLSSSENVVTAAAQNKLTADDMIELESTVIQRYRGSGVFILHPKTMTMLKKLKDENGNYMLQRDLTKGFGYTILGHQVYESDQMPKATAGNKAIIFGDISGLYVKLAPNPQLQVLREKYADEHALGVVAWIEADSKIVEPQKIAVLQMAAAPEPEPDPEPGNEVEGE